MLNEEIKNVKQQKSVHRHMRDTLNAWRRAGFFHLSHVPAVPTLPNNEGAWNWKARLRLALGILKYIRNTAISITIQHRSIGLVV